MSDEGRPPKGTASATTTIEPASSALNGTEIARELSAFHRADLHASGITDEALAEAGVWSGSIGWVLPWRDGVESIEVGVFDRDKRPADGRKVAWPQGQTSFPNVLRWHETGDVLVVEGVRQMLAAFSHAPEGCSVVGVNGCDGIHGGIADRLDRFAGRRVTLAFDADRKTNARVRGAVERVTRLLIDAGAIEVRALDYRQLIETPKDGLDDVLARAEKPGELIAELVEKAEHVGGPAVTATSRLDDAFFTLAELENLPQPEPLVSGILDRSSVTVLAGKFGTYKSFVALSLAASVATGRPWGTHTVPEPGPVIYVAAEGAWTILPRLKAWQERHGSIPPQDFRAVTRPVRMTSDEDAAWLREKVTETGARLVVIDTWRQSTPGAEENSSTEMSAAFSRAASIRNDTGAAVLVLHHTGHNGVRARGSSAIEDDADAAFVIQLAGADDEDRSPQNTRVMVHRKSKNGALLEDFALQAHPVAESIVVEPDPFPVIRTRGRGRPKDESMDRAVAAMVDGADAAGVPDGLGYRELKRWAEDHGIARVTEVIARRAAKVRQGRRPGGSGGDGSEKGSENDDGAAAAAATGGAVENPPPRGVDLPPQSSSGCGGNAVENAEGFSTAPPPAETRPEDSSAASCGGKAGRFSTAPVAGGAVRIFHRTSGGPRTLAPVTTEADPLDSVIDLVETPAAQLCPDCDSPKELVPPTNFWLACRRCTPGTFEWGAA